MSLLNIDSINAGYKDIQVLFDLSIEVDEGEIVSIIGANGVGKTTLLKSVSGILKIVSGKMTFCGESIVENDSSEIVEKGLIHVPEGRRLFSLMTVYENLEMGAYCGRAKAKFQKNLEEVYNLFPRLKERRDQLAVTLSGGEQQMVAIGRGIMSDPKLMMLDEPSLGLAPVLKKDIFSAIKKIASERKTTILLVEQDVINSLKISDRAYVMEHGHVVMSGSAQEILNDSDVKKAYLGI